MDINEKYLEENREDILKNVKALEMMRGAFTIMEESELEFYKEGLYKKSLNEYIAFTHIHDGIELNENMVRHVNSKGVRGMRKSRDVRSKLAYKTTTLSKARRRETALKASKTRMSRPSLIKRASRKRNKAKRKRTSLGFDS